MPILETRTGYQRSSSAGEDLVLEVVLVFGLGYVFVLVLVLFLVVDVVQACREARCDAIVLLSSLAYASPGHASSFR